MELRKLVTAALIAGFALGTTPTFAAESRISHSPNFYKTQYVPVVVCYAQDTAGNVWSWAGPNIYVAQTQAFRLCANNSLVGGCFISSCL